jgi:secondary thiamine-phosphate synthase enzyme
MTVITKKIKIDTKGNTDIINITDKVREFVSGSGINDGIAVVFIPGATGGLTTIEYEPGLVADFKAFFDKTIPESAEYQHNLRWDDGNGHSHVRASLLGPDVSIPFADKKMMLGRWQEIIFVDFDNRPRTRELVVQIIGL